MLCCLAVLFLFAGCRQDMQDQPRYEPLEKSDFYADERSSRPLVEDTVARGHLDDDTAYYDGKDANGKAVTSFPLEVNEPLIRRGQERFNIYCSPCHDYNGTGNGMVTRRGFRHPPSFHMDRLRKEPVGYLYDVITHGFGAMPDYAMQLNAQDRWAVIAYIRALQYSKNASVSDVPESDRPKLDATTTPNEHE